MTDSATATIEPPDVTTNEVDASVPDVIAPVFIRDQAETGTGLFAGLLEPRGQVSFGSNVTPIEVSFLGESPFVDLGKSFTVNRGPAVTATVSPEKGSGIYVFDLRALDGSFEFLGLSFHVAEKQPYAQTYRIGYLVDAGDAAPELTLQTYVKPGRRSVDARVVNETKVDQTLELTEAQGESTTRVVPGGGTANHRFMPPGLGSVLRVELSDDGASALAADTGGGGYRDENGGGLQQADIIVEPPP